MHALMNACFDATVMQNATNIVKLD